MKRRIIFTCLLGILLLGFIAGCNLTKKKEAPAPKKNAVLVETMKPIRREIVDYEEFTGMTGAVNDVQIQAQVAGILTKCDFTEGTEVTKDSVLFEIEPELYQAAYDTAVGNLQSMTAELDTLKAREPQLRREKDRQVTLIQSHTTSESEFDSASAAYTECLAKIAKGEADIVKAQAEVKKAEINLKYTKILSPIDGYISHKLVTEGNLVQPHITNLARVVSLDPIYVYFYVDETTYLDLVDLMEQEAARSSAKALRIEYRLTNESSFLGEDGRPLHTGTVQYTAPLMDESSGTVQLRATCPNPRSENVAMNRIIPGITVHIRIPVSENYNALLVPEEALGTEQGIRYLYVADAEGKAQIRRLTLGPLQSDNMRVIREGIKPDDTIIVSGLLRLRPGVDIEQRETTLEKLREGIKGLDNEESASKPEEKTDAPAPVQSNLNQPELNQSELSPSEPNTPVPAVPNSDSPALIPVTGDPKPADNQADEQSPSRAI